MNLWGQTLHCGGLYVSQMDVARLARLHLAFTLAMVGLMSTVQLVVYPQYRIVAEADFAAYVSNHGQLIGIPLVLFAPAEVLLALFLWLRTPAGKVKAVAFGSGLVLAVVWVTTIAWFAPLHGRLTTDAYDPDRIEQLIDTNWFRTGLWWVRGLLAFWLVEATSRLCRPAPGRG